MYDMALWEKKWEKAPDNFQNESVYTELLDIVKNTNNFDDILNKDDRFEILYNLSPLRENIINWYSFKPNSTILEIGSECGAITGYLCHIAKKVVSVEPSKIRSEICYNRYKELENLTVITGFLSDVEINEKFDYVILNNSFEYLPTIIQSDSPYDYFFEFLEKVILQKSKILITLSNRIGIQYLSGTVEESSKELFYGIEHDQNTKKRFFSKRELVSIFKKWNFENISFFYPVPDHIFPEIIYTDFSLYDMELSVHNRNFESNRLSLFNDSALLRILEKERIADKFLNSYLIEISNEKNDGTESLIYAKISNDRKSEFQIITEIIGRNNQRYVLKKPANANAFTHIEKMNEYYIKNPKDSNMINIPSKLIDNELYMDFQDGLTLEKILINLLSENKLNEFENWITDFGGKILGESTLRNDYATEEFQNVFGVCSERIQFHCKKNSNIDLIFSNVFPTREGYVVIDYEWVFDFWIPQEYVIWRSLFHFYTSNDYIKTRYDIRSFLSVAGIKDEWHSIFVNWDDHFGNKYVRRDVLSSYAKKNLPISNTLKKVLKFSEPQPMKLFVDYGDGYSSKAVYESRWIENGSEFVVTFCLDQSHLPIKGLRFDPCENRCKLTELSIDHELFFSHDNSEIEINNWKYFLTDDPMIFIKGDFTKIHFIKISGILSTVDDGEYEHVLKKYEQDIQFTIQNLKKKSSKECKMMTNLKKTRKTTKFLRVNKKIRHNIESVEETKDKIILTGWAFEEESKEIVSFAIIGKLYGDVFYRRCLREDVNEHFNLIENTKYGFEIILSMEWKDLNIPLKLYTENNSCQVRLDLSGKKYDYLKKISSYGNIIRSIRKKLFRKIDSQLKYEKWIERTEIHLVNSFKNKKYKENPKISIIVPVYNVEKKYLTECVNSVFDQSYSNWELCLIDDCSDKAYIINYFDELSQDSRIKCKIRDSNGHISKASNDGLEMATGDYIGLLDHDDTLAPFALERVVSLINKYSEAEIIYSDEDKIDKRGKRSNPFFKPDWSPDTLLAQNYICHFTVIKKELVEKVGGFEVGIEGAQDYDLVLKCTEESKNIYHIPEILYHWRMLESSTAENPDSKKYAFDAGKCAIENALIRRNISGIVKQGDYLGTYVVSYLPKGNPLVSIIIPTKNHADDLKKCIDSIINNSGYSRFEIIVVDNGSNQKDLLLLYEYYKNVFKSAFKVLALDIPFNYSRLNNEAVKITNGDYLLLLNNDIEMISSNWMIEMLGYAQQEHIAAVGARLLYPDNTIQHAGVVVGIGGVAGHSHKYFDINNPGYFNRLVIPANYSAVTAACLMIEKKKYKEVGGLDEENLSVAFNDVDFCLKLIKKGYYNVALSQVEGYHYESKSRGHEDNKEKQERFKKEVKYMKNKWEQILLKDPFYSRNLTLKNEDFSIK